MTDLAKIKKHFARLKELNSIPFKSDEETQEAEQLIKELSDLLTDIGISDLKELDQLHLMDEPSYQSNIDRFNLDEINYLAKNQDKDIRIEEKVTEMKLRELERQKKNLINMIKLAKTQEDVDKLKESLHEITKEANYITTKPDKDGMVHIRDEVLQRRIAQLEQELDETESMFKRWRLKSKIDSLKSLKKSIQIRNTTIKVARGAKKVSETISNIGNELSELGKYSGYVDTKTKKKKGDKGDDTDDFGFNPKSMFKK